MKPIVVSDVLAVGEFPTIEQLEILAKAGFRSIINNQPDGEVSRFPAADSMAAEAEKLGLKYAYVPIETRHPEPEALAKFAAAMRALPDPIFAFDYSGARSAAACAFVLAETQDVSSIVAELEAGGFDVRALVPWLEDERARHTAAAKSAAGEAAKADDTASGGKAAGNGAGAVSVAAGERAAPPVVRVPAPTVVYPRAAGFDGGGYAM